MKLNDYFDGLLDSAVNINPNRLRQLDEHVDAIKGYLKGSDGLSPLIRTFIPQGSWAQRTIIKPLPGQEFDADVLVSFKHQRRWSKDPEQYLLGLYETLASASRYRNKVELKTRCVRVVYANDCHIDLVPYVHIPGYFPRHLIVNRRENQFENVNPEGFAVWMRGRDRLTHGHLRKSIRLLKYLRDYKRTFVAPSVILTIIMGTRVNWWTSWLLEGYTDLPSTFVRLVKGTDRWLQDHPELPEITDPSCQDARFDHRFTKGEYVNFRTKFHGYAGKVEAAAASSSLEESVTLWREIFGDEFRPVRG